VYIKTTKPNIREISLTAVLGTVIVLEFGWAWELTPRVQGFMLVHDLTTLL
jgi:hypothetical protein